MGTTYGYARVSSTNQNEIRQIVAMREKGIPDTHIYIDKQSGKDFHRPQYQAMLRRLKTRDLLCITSIDRLGRNYTEILEQWRYLTHAKKVDIQVIDMPLLDTSHNKNLLGTFISDLVLQLLSFVAQNERDNIRKRQAEGIAAAKARGVHFGRHPKPLPSDFAWAFAQWREGELTTSAAARQCGMPRTSFYKRARNIILQKVPEDPEKSGME